jgi:hypothetical protein
MNSYAATATDIKETIRSAEGLVDEALSTIAVLKRKIIIARGHPDVTPHEGQKALMRLHRAEQQILAGSNDLFRAHDEMSSIAIRMDVEHPTGPSGLIESEDEFELLAD